MIIVVNIPAYNEATTIADVILKIPKTIHGHDVVIQVVDDGSSDATVSAVKKSGVTHILSHSYNQGVGAAFRTGVEHFLDIGGDIFVNIDADGQFNPADIEGLIAPIVAGDADISIASRFADCKAQNIPRVKDKGNRLIAWIVSKLMHYPIQDLTCGFRAYSRKSLFKLNLVHLFTYTQEVIIDAIGKNMRIVWIPIEVIYFADRKSRVTGSLGKYIQKSVLIIFRTVRDVKPLIFFGVPGLIVFTLGFLFSLVFLVLYLMNFKTTPYRTYMIIGISGIVIGLLLLVFASIADMIKSQRKISEENLEILKRLKYDRK